MDNKFLYHTFLGRFILKIITRPSISKIAGTYMDSKMSAGLIDGFIKKNCINMQEYEEKEYKSFNDFFTRTLKVGMRNIDMTPSSLISPCDGLLSAYHIDENSVFKIKDSLYTVNDLICDEKLSKKYINGTCVIIRLTVTDYHRYIYFDNGTKDNNVFIKGILHTVRPIAQEKYKIYKTNSREYSVLHTENFGDVIQTEVGALMVGKIVNLHQKHSFLRGDEKGRFEFGGSTVVLLFKENTVDIDENIFELSQKDIESKVKMGQKIGVSICQKE